MDIREYYAKPGLTIEEHSRMLIRELDRMKEYGYIDGEHLYKLAFLACLHHDDGKANELFLERVQSEKKKFNPEELPHNVLSGFLLNSDEFESEEDYLKVLYAILYHHDYGGDPIRIIEEKEELAKTLLKNFAIQEITIITLSDVQNIMENPEAIKVKGFLHKCDYSASGGYVSEYPNDFLEASLENVKEKWRRINPESDWNELQRFCMSRRDENVIAIAQTGMGKTEAGLQWIGNRKGYFVLPLRTAINAIYERVRREILLDERIDTRLSILHSESLEYYINHDNKEYDLEEYEKRGKNLTMPLSISTMDQLFDFIFKYQGYELKLTTFSYSRIVIDEIQMYNPELLRCLIYGLHMITQMGGKVAVMTATLSPFVKDLLRQSVPFEEENIRTFVDDTLRHHIEAREKEINAENIAAFYHKNKENGTGNKILVVCNTIRKAQELYEELRDFVEKGELHILHSRFTRKDRAVKEKEIIDFGRTFDENGDLDCRSGIWISTSLVEASLDIDFDYLFTELQDLTSLFQRLGRCNRKGKKDCTMPNCFIYTEIEPTTLTNGDRGFIDSDIFKLSKCAVEEGEGLLSEQRKIELLNKYMTMEKVRGSDYYKRYKSADWVEMLNPYEIKNHEKKLRDIFTQEVIPSPVYEKEKEQIQKIMEQMTEPEISSLDKRKLKEELLKYSVNIPLWHWKKYLSARRKGFTENFPTLQYGKYMKIPVMECCYDDAGYRLQDYENKIRDAEIL